MTINHAGSVRSEVQNADSFAGRAADKLLE